MKRLYDQREVSKLIGISESQIRYWDKIGLIPNMEKKKGLLFFDFKGLVAFRTVKRLLDRGISLRTIRKCVGQLKSIMPGIEQPLTGLRISMCGGQLVVSKDNQTLTPEGQLLINFSTDVSSPIPLPVDAAEENFFQALEATQEEDLEEAKKRYESVLALRPEHIDSLVNIGNIMHKLDSSALAEHYYRKALWLNPDHVEANYNLANIFEERNDLDNSILFYKKAIHEDPDFADAHFNLARILEKIGEKGEAKKHWRLYLYLDPSSEWAQYAKLRLEDDEP